MVWAQCVCVCEASIRTQDVNRSLGSATEEAEEERSGRLVVVVEVTATGGPVGGDDETTRRKPASFLWCGKQERGATRFIKAGRQMPIVMRSTNRVWAGCKT